MQEGVQATSFLETQQLSELTLFISAVAINWLQLLLTAMISTSQHPFIANTLHTVYSHAHWSMYITVPTAALTICKSEYLQNRRERAKICGVCCHADMIGGERLQIGDSGDSILAIT